MKRNDFHHQCLSLTEIKAYSNNELSEQEKNKATAHFSTCELCKEVKESFSTVNQLGVEEDITDLKVELFDTINRRSMTTRRLFLSKIAAGILLPVTGATAFFYWNSTANDRLFQEHFQSYPVLDEGTRSVDEVVQYENISLPKELKLALAFYKAKDYQASLPHFKAYHTTQSQNNYANFLYGLASLETDHIDQAIYSFKEVRTAPNDYYLDATWYLALANIKKKDKKAAIPLLTELISGNNFYTNKAKKLKSQL